jgi:hypothetical protein
MQLKLQKYHNTFQVFKNINKVFLHTGKKNMMRCDGV